MKLIFFSRSQANYSSWLEILTKKSSRKMLRHWPRNINIIERFILIPNLSINYQFYMLLNKYQGVVCIFGNDGTGKSTITKILQEQDPTYLFLERSLQTDD